MYCMELTVEHDLGHDCMELNQGKHGDESENQAVHEPCSVGNLSDGIRLNMKHGIPVMDSGINMLWFQLHEMNARTTW